MPRMPPTQSQLVRVANAAKVAARKKSSVATLSVSHVVPVLMCPVIAELLDDMTIEVLPILDCWDANYQDECQRLSVVFDPIDYEV